MAGADQTPCGPDRDRAIFFDDFICGRIGKEANPALGTGLGHSRQILERMKCRLTGVTQRMAGSIAGFIPGNFSAPDLEHRLQPDLIIPRLDQLGTKATVLDVGY